MANSNSVQQQSRMLEQLVGEMKTLSAETKKKYPNIRDVSLVYIFQIQLRGRRYTIFPPKKNLSLHNSPLERPTLPRYVDA